MPPHSLIPDVIASSRRPPVDLVEIAEHSTEPPHAKTPTSPTNESADPVSAAPAVVEDPVSSVETNVEEDDAANSVADPADELVIVDMEQRMTLRQLRDMCSERGLSTAGRKSDLVARITEHDRSK